MASGQESREELDAKARQGETVVPGGTGGKSLEAQQHLAEGRSRGGQTRREQLGHEGYQELGTKGGQTRKEQMGTEGYQQTGHGVCKSEFKLSTRANSEENRLWGWNSMEMQHVVRGKKSTAKFLKAGSTSDSYGFADGGYRKQFKRQQKQNEAFSNRTMGNNNQNTEASLEKLPVRNQDRPVLEEGQISTEEPKTEVFNVKKYSSDTAQNDTLKGRLSHKIHTSQKDNRVYDENRILETMAKMEKRRERFKDPILVKKDTDPDSKLEDKKSVEMAESKVQRPARKRKWGGS